MTSLNTNSEKRETATEKLAQSINSFNYVYIYSDNENTYRKWLASEKSIINDIHALSQTQLTTLYSDIKENYRDQQFGALIIKILGYTPEIIKTAPVKQIIDKKSLFKAAWTYIRKGIATSFKDALKLAWKRLKALIKLKNQHVVFNYRKVNGRKRMAFGTLQGHDIDNTNPELIIYYDTAKKGIRSFKISNLLYI